MTEDSTAELKVSDADITKVFKEVTGMVPRLCDLHVVHLSGGTREALADYLWDHWLGEPEEFDADTMREKVIDTILGGTK